MSNISQSPFFQQLQAQHFTDYGFEPQIDYFQEVLEEARKQRRETMSSRSNNIDINNFRLQKPPTSSSRGELLPSTSRKIIKKNKNKKQRWWRNPLVFFKFPRWRPPPPPSEIMGGAATTTTTAPHHHIHASISGPLYFTDSISMTTTGSHIPYRPGWSGPLGKADGEIPYISLRELDLDDAGGKSRTSGAAATPIYLVT